MVFSLKAAARSDKVDDEQINSVFIVIARLPRNLSHQHDLLCAEVVSEAGDTVSILRKGASEKESDGFCLLSD